MHVDSIVLQNAAVLIVFTYMITQTQSGVCASTLA